MPTSPAIELLLRQAGRGVGQINARTAGISGALQPIAGRVASTYANLQGQEQALGGALEGALAGAGAAAGADIGGKLQGIQAPAQAVQQYGGGQTTMGAQSGAAVGALSSADLQRLRSQGSAEQIYAAALPRLAALAGEQERRNFLSSMQDDLMDLSLQEAARQRETAVDNARYERDFRYKAQQDRIARKREDREFRYETKQDRLDRRRQTGLDRLATSAAAAEYGLDVANMQADNATSQGNLTERQRHNRQLEQQARAREQRQRAKDAKSGTGKKGDDKPFYDAREDAFKRAREYANPKSKLADPMPRAKARVRLWAEFGALLTGRGYDRSTVKNMIERALDAAGI